MPADVHVNGEATKVKGDEGPILDAKAGADGVHSVVKRAAVLAEHAAEIRKLAAQTIQNFIEIGRRLRVVKDDLLGHGKFLDWIDKEFDLSADTAENYIRLHKVFGGESKSERIDPNSERVRNLGSLPLRSLYLLSAKSTPESVRREVEDEAKAGKSPTHEQIKKKVAKAKARASARPSNPESAASAPAAPSNGAEPSAKPAAAKPAAPTTPADPPAQPGDLKTALHAATPEQRKAALQTLTSHELAAALPDGWGKIAELQAELARERKEAVDVGIKLQAENLRLIHALKSADIEIAKLGGPIKPRKNKFPKATQRAIIKCLHPDTRKDATDADKDEACALFNALMEHKK